MTGRRLANLISRDNGIGLTTDVHLLTEWLTDCGFDVQFVDWRARMMRRCHLAVFIELLNPTLVYYAVATVGILNLEWLPQRWAPQLRRLTQVWARSAESEQLMRGWGLPRVHRTGFLGSDLYDTRVPREVSCLHMRGASGLKGTGAVLQAWADNPGLPALTVISHDPIPHPPKGVTVLPRVDESTLRRLANQCLIHVCPSESEGWGHYICEGLSCGALVVTTDASPMSEHVQPQWGWLLPARPGPDHHMAPRHLVDAADIAAAVDAAATLPRRRREDMQHDARQHFLSRNDQFRAAAGQLLHTLVP